MDIYDRIDSLLQMKNVNRKQMCTDLNLSYNSLMANYNRKSTKISFETLLAIARYLDASVDYLIGNPINKMDNMDIQHLTKFQKLNKAGKQKATAYVEDIQLAYPRIDKIKPAAQTNHEEPRKKPWFLPLYAYPASAGQGVLAGEGDYDLVEVPEDVPISASFGVRISGDSMEPVIPHNSIVWVRQQPDVAIGEICIVVIEDEGYCKIRDKNSFKSINPKYKDIKPGAEETVRISGKVVYIQKSEGSYNYK